MASTLAIPGTLRAQPAPTGSPSTVTSLEPIYWKQSLFQIPYQWGSAAEPGAAQLVLLYVSKDRGVSWQKISEARPNVTSFNYRAEGEGEYWFAVRTLDHQGEFWPKGEYSPEIRVIVDTTMPQITNLRAFFRADGAIEIERTGLDQNLDPTTWKFEIQAHATGPWQEVPHRELYAATASSAEFANSPGTGFVELQPPAGQNASAVRATVLDRAGNMATYHTSIQPAGPVSPHSDTTTDTSTQRLPNVGLPGALTANPPINNPYVSVSQSIPPPVSTATSSNVAAATETHPRGWVSSSDASSPTSPQPTAPTDQPWPASTTTRAPFRLWSGGPAMADDAVTSYGNPSGIVAPSVAESGSNSTPSIANSSAWRAAPGDPQEAAMTHNVQPLGPFRQASIGRSPAPSESEPISAVGPVSQLAEAQAILPPVSAYSQQLPPDAQPKLVGSRTFALEYELDDAGGRGVSNVELWGTRDGGQTWRAYTRDDDNRSPLVVTVDEDGLFGFRIVVESAGGAAPSRPAPGDRPELWVAVDLHRPTAELTAVEPGNGNMADHLILRWRAMDDNLESRPISFYYSSRPVGPWSAVATSLENTGEYAWRVERHVPTRFYLRLEARDTAGNLAAFQTRDPIEFTAPSASGRLRSAEPIDPTATGTSASYR